MLPEKVSQEENDDCSWEGWGLAWKKFWVSLALDSAGEMDPKLSKAELSGEVIN